MRIRRPGLAESARRLNVSYQHLWRVVVSGERKSPSLIRRYQRLTKSKQTAPISATAGRHHNSPPAPETAQAIISAVAENLSPAFFQTLQDIGIEVVIVHFTSPTDWPIYKGAGIESVLEAELIRASAGQYYASDYLPNGVFHVFHVFTKCLGKALNVLKTTLQARDLLEKTTILHGETHDALRIYYPPHHPETQVIDLSEGEATA